MASPPSNHFIASLQILPEFFTYFNSDESHHSTIPLELFYIIMLRMEICGFTSMYFTLFQPLTKVLLTFQRSSHEPKVMLCELDSLPLELEEMEQIDYGTFVSIDSQDFRRIVLELDVHSVHVSLTDSQVKFGASRKEIVLTKEERQCIIGGLAEGEGFEFSITLHPLAFFHELSYKAKRAWLFMSINFSTIIVFPLGTLNVQCPGLRRDLIICETVWLDLNLNLNNNLNITHGG
ncbi:uncharacterized protein LOC111807005 [Cucurbita pepo subsp. pepo]|uniref:uncharacterized protein LOC111807005 n=1 Tax=Cucurbita pepo subsp. pepo TaxID=3664 RepID=UPI000C9D60E3|nr:uncharacterized protein LOC111807005 [Cucurbita pepo subsp. pepo]